MNYKCSAVNQMGDRLATINMGRKVVAVVPLSWRGAGPYLTQWGQGRGLPSCRVSSWSIQPFGHNTPRLQTERQTDRQTDRQTGQDRQWFDSTGPTVLQTVAQNVSCAVCQHKFVADIMSYKECNTSLYILTGFSTNHVKTWATKLTRVRLACRTKVYCFKLLLYTYFLNNLHTTYVWP